MEKKYVPFIFFKFDPNRIDKIGEKTFLIITTDDETIKSQVDFYSTTDILSIETSSLADASLEDSSILTSGNEYFMVDLKNSLLKKIDRDVVNSIIKL